ncbi:MAG: hypothetical protein A3J96_07385 [Sulfurimonas sp. RIFOXYC2_FULL_36_7]|nr:MAG: hypothetical protein A3J96_07385 [Sulfurimonas sp. RIFOXYC2_FULL_36_7]
MIFSAYHFNILNYIPFFNISKSSKFIKYLLINLQAPAVKLTKARFAEMAFLGLLGVQEIALRVIYS